MTNDVSRDVSLPAFLLDDLEEAVDDRLQIAGVKNHIDILHVDDNHNIGTLVAEFLRRENGSFEIRTETHPADALEAIDRDDADFDCVVSDYEMPGMNGLELLEELRKRYSDLPFILFTGKGNEEIASEAISAGVTDYLQKSTGTDQYEVLANRIQNSVRGYRAENHAVRGFRAMNQAPIGITITDPRKADNPIVFVSDGFVELTGYPRSEALGRNCRFLQGEHTDDETIRDVRDAIRNEGPVTVEMRNYRRDGSEFWNRLDIAPIRDETGTVTHFVGFQQDVTARRELLAEFEALGDVLSHDMMNPIQTIRGRLRLALETGEETHVDEALPALERLEHLITDISEVLKAGSIVSEQTRLEVGTLAESVWDALDSYDTDGTLSIDGAPEIVGDERSVTRLLDNLLGNSLEHGTGEVTVRVGELTDGFYVADDGPGIPEQNREKVFEQGFTTKEENGGTGLGMASVRQIALAHGWRIYVDDDDTLGGVRFEIRTGE
ncbi:response regulator [Natrarchaeobius halalkaliphilus]|uniref:Response regulator n=1 Tax=Natrarchaeobius halalkaliphilus TaxID=1679091 RepID=A0A3N6MGE7_9EURY|nr:response regulator [Natrarchaeobius halalkaliphilus]RQG93016.1 response regulator [Natrarchaeobius halalkaliphilus]